MSYFSFVMLWVDLVTNLAGIVLGVVLALKASDNRIRLLWGVMVAVCSLSMFIDNLGWLDRFMKSFGLEERNSLLVFSRMLKWYFFVHVLSLFPIASLKPGWLTPLRILVFSLPLAFSSLVCLCYLWFAGSILPLSTMSDVLANLHYTDVQLRLGLFFLSVIGPVSYFLIPFMGKWIVLQRRMKPGMYFYIVGLFTILLLYIFFITGTTDWVFTLYGFTVTFLPNVFTVLYILDENPLSAPRMPEQLKQLGEKELEQSPVSAVVYEAYQEMVGYILAAKPFVNPKYTLEQLSEALGVKKGNLVKAIHYAGFSGFNEMINYHRLEYFKELVVESADLSIKELMFRCGFNSRSSFYRRFSAMEGMSPKEYIVKVLSGKS